MTRTTLQTCITAALFLGLALASSGTDIGATVKIGTQGVGADVTVGLTPELNVRAGGSLLDVTVTPNDSEGLSGDEVSVAVDLQTLMVLIDWHPARSRFRLSAGVALNNHDIAISADPNDIVSIGLNDYRIATLTGTVDIDAVAPYIGIGYGNAVDRSGRWFFAFDLGAVIHGSPDVQLDAVAANPARQPALDIDLEIERRDLQDDADAFVLYPVISIGLSYRF